MGEDVWKCPECGTIAAENTRFCVKCGASVPQYWECTGCGEKHNLDNEQECHKCRLPRYRLREGVWDCLYCGKKLNKGREKHCGGCGVPRGEEVKFYLPEDAELIKDEEIIAQAKIGPDWRCGYCGGDNRGEKEFCTGCGAPRDGAPKRKVIEVRYDRDAAGQKVEYELVKGKLGYTITSRGKTFNADTVDEAFKKFFSSLKETEAHPEEKARTEVKAHPGDAARAAEKEKPHDQTPNKKLSPVLKGCFLGCVGLFVAFFLFAIFLSIPREATGKVSGFYWERIIGTEQLNTLTESKWENEVPGDARIQSRKKEFHHNDKVKTGTETKTKTVTEKVKVGTEKVKVGQKDLGNGMFEDVYEDRPVYKDEKKEVTYQEGVYKDVPVYKMKVTYQIDRWQPSDTKRAEGKDQNAYWPEIKVSERLRQTEKKEQYQVFFEGPRGKALTYKTKDYNEWQGIKDGQSYKLKADLVGNVRQILK